MDITFQNLRLITKARLFKRSHQEQRVPKWVVQKTWRICRPFQLLKYLLVDLKTGDQSLFLPSSSNIRRGNWRTYSVTNRIRVQFPLQYCRAALVGQGIHCLLLPTVCFSLASRAEIAQDLGPLKTGGQRAVMAIGRSTRAELASKVIKEQPSAQQTSPSVFGLGWGESGGEA